MTVSVKGMTCEHCVRAVRTAIESLPEVEKAEVDLESGRARIRTRGQELPSKENLADVIEEAGYELGE